MTAVLDAETKARVRAYADRKGLTETDAVSALLDAGLRSHERAVSAGKNRAAGMTTNDRKRASRARWGTKSKGGR